MKPEAQEPEPQGAGYLLTPTQEQRDYVEQLASYGVPQEDIARVAVGDIPIDPKTLRKHFRKELDTGATTANAKIAGALFSNALGGNTTAQIFWLKTRARWKETTKLELGRSLSFDAEALKKLSGAELDAFIGILEKIGFGDEAKEAAEGGDAE